MSVMAVAALSVLLMAVSCGYVVGRYEGWWK